MKNVLIILLTLGSLGAFAQSNPLMNTKTNVMHK